MASFVEQVKARFTDEHLLLAAAVPPDDDAYDLKRLGAAVDYVVPMVYDEHYQSGAPGPVASEDWFEGQLDHLSKIVPPQKTVIGVGNYGYDWVIGGTAATELSFQQVVSAAHVNKTNVVWDKDQENPVLRYTSAKSGKQHEIWFLDAVTALNQIQAARDGEFRGIGVWRLGAEDSGMWDTLPSRDWPGEHFNTVGLDQMNSLQIVDRYGDGDVLRVVDTPHDGVRNVWQETDGDYAEQYQQFPSYYVVEANGPEAGEGKQLVLTFDDGPDPEWTPKILDVLKTEHVPAAFFVIGLNAESFPGLIKRVYNEGHLLGNHTYSHPNIATVSPERLRIELNFTQRLIEHDTGHATTLFRPPYNADSEPTTAEEVAPIWHAENEYHYTMVGERIDPQDWRPGVTTTQIVDEVMSEKSNGHIILLHDGGGDRSATLKALPLLISRLRTQGYQFVGLDQLLGNSRAQLMPLPSADEARLAGLEGNALTTKGTAIRLLGVFFLVAIGLTVMRSLVFGAMAVIQKLRLRLRRFKPGFAPPVSVIVAAYNEEKVITKTVDSILRSEYPELEVIVVDDGSSDHTFQIVQNTYSGDPRVRIFRQVNAGKSAALNRAIAESRHNLLIALDADTIFDRSTIGKLIRHFAEPQVGAVSGNAKVGNKKSWLTRFQSMEYVCGFNLDRRALDLLNAITVVPGAVGAWRKDLIERVGGFGHDTLAEDTDVTLAIRRLGFEIRYEEEAVAYTESAGNHGGPRQAALPVGFRHSPGRLETSRRTAPAALRRTGVCGAAQYLDISGAARDPGSACGNRPAARAFLRQLESRNSRRRRVSDPRFSDGAANRENAKLSTGPKTDEGKQRSSRNSFKHGLTGQIHIATIEEMATYQAFCQEYFDEYKPAGPTEKGMVQNLADTQWQINHASTLINNIHPNDEGELSVEQSQQMDRYSRHASRFKRDFERTLKQLTEHQKQRKAYGFVDLRQAGQIHDLHEMLGEEWDPPQYGFDLTIPQNRKIHASPQRHPGCRNGHVRQLRQEGLPKRDGQEWGVKPNRSDLAHFTSTKVPPCKIDSMC